MIVKKKSPDWLHNLNWATCENVPLADRKIDPITFHCEDHGDLIQKVLDPCVTEIGPVMTGLWKKNQFVTYRRYMVGFLAKSKYHPAIPLLEDFINEENQFFSTHPLQKRWLWQQGTDAGEEIYQHYGALRAAMWALKEIGAESKSEAFHTACAWWENLEENPIPPDMPCPTK